MSRLIKYAKEEDIMKVAIKYGEKTFRFNLGEETRIEEGNIQHNMIRHPQAYSFLIMLHKKCLAKMKDAQRTYRRIQARAKERYTAELGAVNRAEMAMLKDKKVIAAQKEYDKAEYDAWVVEACVKSMEVRKDLMQTLAANERTERRHT
jgi:hypothetical protein